MIVRAGLLYQLHETAFHALYADVERAAEAQEKVFVGAPGTIVQHRRCEADYYSRQFLDGDGKQRQTYLAGPVGSQEAEAMVEQMTNRIAEVKALIKTIRGLGTLSFSMADATTYAPVGSMFNYGVFNAGGMLIGSHAYGVILNRLGIRAASYHTDDIDIARQEQQALIDIPAGGILEILQQTGIRFVEVQQLQGAAPATSFMESVFAVSRHTIDYAVAGLKGHSIAAADAVLQRTIDAAAARQLREGTAVITAEDVRAAHPHHPEVGLHRQLHSLPWVVGATGAPTPHQNEEQPLRVLTIDVSSSDQWLNKTAPFFRDPGENRTYISFVNPARVLRFMNEKRFRIVQLLVKDGPLTAGDVAARLRRNRMMLDRDLEALFEGEVIERDREHRYFYEFDGLRILLQYPLPDDSDEPRGRSPARYRPASCRRKPFRRSRLRELPVLRRKRYHEPEAAQAVPAAKAPKSTEVVDRKTVSRILLVGAILAVTLMLVGLFMQLVS